MGCLLALVLALSMSGLIRAAEDDSTFTIVKVYESMARYAAAVAARPCEAVIVLPGEVTLTERREERCTIRAVDR